MWILKGMTWDWAAKGKAVTIIATVETGSVQWKLHQYNLKAATAQAVGDMCVNGYRCRPQSQNDFSSFAKILPHAPEPGNQRNTALAPTGALEPRALWVQRILSSSPDSIFLVIQVTHCQPYPRPPYIQTLAPPKRHKTTKEKKQFIICYNSLSLNEHRMMKLKVCIITQTKKQRRDVLSWKVQWK